MFPFIRLLENYLKILAARLVKLQLSRQYYSILYKWYFHWYRLQYLYNKLLKPNFLVLLIYCCGRKGPLDAPGSFNSQKQ